MKKLANKIIGIAIVTILLLQQAPGAYAIFSPTIGAETASIKQHILTAREQNGVGSFWNVYDKALETEEERRRTFGVYSVPPGSLGIFKDAVKAIVIEQVASSFGDGFSLMFGSFFETSENITTCRRDDIWELQALQEEVLNETFKSALLNNVADASLLLSDYKGLQAMIEILKNDGENGYKNTKLFFPNQDQNFYTDCPYGEFTQAFQKVKRSWDQLLATFTGKSLSNWGSLAEAAKKRAKARAAKWIAANQIKLTFGGEEGGNPESLKETPGVKALSKELTSNWALTKKSIVGKLEAIWDFIRKGESGVATEITADTIKSMKPAEFGQATIDMIQGIKKVITKDPADVYQIIKGEQTMQIAKEKALDFRAGEIKYNIQLGNVSEESLKTVERIMFSINAEIRRAYTTDTSPDNLKAFCEKFRTAAKIQCKNKSGGDAPSCIK